MPEFSELREAREFNRREAETVRAPTKCPICGWPLEVKALIRNCPMGHFRYEG